MRKLLLASAAVLGATSGLAFAQAPAGNQMTGQYVAPRVGGPAANNNNNNWGTANTVSGDAAASPITRLYAPNTVAVPTPGTIVIRLNGKIQADFGFYNSSADRIGAVKLNPVMVSSYMRLYPGFDGMAANGLRYGASIELRENFNNANAVNQTAFAPTAATTGVTISSSGSANSSTQTVFVRRAFTYLATDQAGIIRLGNTDGVQGLMDPGIFTSQSWDGGVGNFNGGTAQALQAANAQIPFIWVSQAGAEYGNNKIVYLSPQFMGLDVGIDYSPNAGNGNQINGPTCSTGAITCVNVSSGLTGSPNWINKFTFGARYMTVLSGIDLKAYGTYVVAGQQGSSSATKFDNLSFAQLGAAVTTMGFTVAADWLTGATNSGQYAMRPAGGKSMNAVVAGLTYANGPFVVGAEVGMVDSQGAAAMVGKSQRHEFEVAFGGTYTVAPGLAIVGEYLYEQRHQGGWNFNTGSGGAAGATTDVKGQGVLVSTVLSW